MTKVGLYTIGTSTTLESNKSLSRKGAQLLSGFAQPVQHGSGIDLKDPGRGANAVDLRRSLMRASYVKGCIHEQLNQDKR